MQHWKIVLSATLLVLVGGFGAVGWFIAKHGRGLGPVLRKPPENIVDILNTTGMPLTLPPGFSISTFAKDIEKPRVLTRGPDGLVVASIPVQGRVVALPDRDHDGIADEVMTVVDGLNRPHGIRFHAGDGWNLYIAESHRVARWNYDVATMRASNPETVIELPDGGAHWTRTIELARDTGGAEQIFVSVGSTCNVCEEDDWRRTKVLAANLDGSNLRVYASGLRNAVFLAVSPFGGRLWVTEMGRDLLGDELPPDEINILEEGADYGWPFCYGKNMQDPYGAKRGVRCDGKRTSHIDLPAHSAPLGLAFVPELGWPPSWERDLLIAFHGSWNRSDPTGYKIVRILLDADGSVAGMEDVISGWLTENNRALGRPVDVLIDPEQLFISDDKAGVIYRVTYRPEGYAVPAASDCRKTGCSAQVCADEDVITTCEFRPEYACYRNATCERQSDGRCGWTSTPELEACLESDRR